MAVIQLNERRHIANLSGLRIGVNLYHIFCIDGPFANPLMSAVRAFDNKGQAQFDHRQGRA